MKKYYKFLNLILLATWLLSGMFVQAQNACDFYLTDKEVPNAVYWLPAPPAPGSSQFMYDISQYYWGKEQRHDTLRAQKAIRAETSLLCQQRSI